MRLATRVPLCALAAVVLAAGAAAAFTPDPVTEALEFPLPAEGRLQSAPTEALADTDPGRAAAIGQGWLVQRNVFSGTVRMAYGGRRALSESGVATEAQAEGLAREFLVTNGDLFGTRLDNLQVRNVKRARGKWVAHYTQTVGGIPVWKGEAFVLMGENGQLTAFGSDFFPEDGLIAHPTLSSQDAVATAAQALGAEVRTDRPIDTELYLVPAPSGELLELAPAWRVVFESEEPFGRWESFVHGLTGEVLGRRNLYHRVNVVGTVEANVNNLPPSYGWCDGETGEFLEHANVSVSGGGTAQTDANGDFDIAHGGASAVNVTTSFQGPWINVNRYTGMGADASLTLSLVPGVPGTFLWTDANSRQDERDTFFHGNVVHDFMKALDAGFTGLDYSMPTVVGRTDGYCPGNAWWDGTAMNYCAAGSIYYNTGELANVIYHEYGHGVTQEVYQANGAPEPPGGLHEGNSDVIANFLDRNPHIGLGFSQSTGCLSGIRNADNSLTYPANNENGGHTAGQVIAGFHWEAWQNMLAALPQGEADQIAFDTWHYARDMGTPQTFPDQVLWTFLVDDDNANLDDGTPHYDFICPAAEQKGFECPEILVGVIINHARLNHVEGTGGSGYQVNATITSTAAALVTSELKVFYRVDGGAFEFVQLVSAGAPDEFTATIPALTANGVVEYYLYAEDAVGNTRTSPSAAPASLWDFDVAYAYDDVEGDVSGWSLGVAGDNATTGVWERIDPVGTAAQPEDDATVDPAGTLAFVTGQCGGPNCSGGCTLGCNDIDNGTTTLLSPVWDMDGATGVRVRVDQWYSNNTGAAPNEDSWVIDLSNDGGSSWTNVYSSTATNAAWTTLDFDVDALFGAADQVRIRFVASDLGSGSVVEAAVDDIRIFGDFAGPPVDAPVVVAGASAFAFDLEAAQPNPFRAATRIAFSVPQRADVSLTVYNVQGQAVRELTRGPREAGRYTVDWDGRDAAGARVATGVYFYRLEANGRALTQKMTVMK
jgi:hypothetical protein